MKGPVASEPRAPSSRPRPQRSSWGHWQSVHNLPAKKPCRIYAPYALDFSGVRFSNPDILAALEAAANGHHNCYTGIGNTIVSYGNSNHHMSGSGMTSSDAWYAGYYQSYRAQQLSKYQQASGYDRQSAAAASDMEPAWGGQLITKQLVNGDTAQGWALYFDWLS
jgi:hypothetical protein